jgi:5-methyltetrahydrofolate--homocysteine methyltransferase
MPIGAMASAGSQVFHLVGRLRDELGVNTTCGASNVSFGLPNRAGINAAFLAMAIGAGLTSAITNPLEAEIRQAILAADVLRGHDPHCATWIRTYREPPAADDPRRRPRRRRP